MIDPAQSLLLTDLYQLTMLSGYHREGMTAPAVFEFFVRDLPPQRNFLLSAGQESVLEFLEGARFQEEELAFLHRSGHFSEGFVDWLADWRFTGEVDALPEGTVCFPDEPILRVTAPLPEAQLVESRIINLLHVQTLLASKAARCTLAAPDKLLVDFGLRRAHGGEAGLFAARSSYIAGFAATATVLAGQRWDIPLSGTVAHSFIEAHDSELDAFEQFALAQPDNVILLIDTYDTEAAARKVVRLAPALRERGIPIKAVRLDSGDLTGHARNVRAILDEGGLHGVKVFSSGDLDEYRLRELAAAPIDGFGVGTRMDTSSDVPYLDCAYKLMEYAGRPRRKKSEGKTTWPGRKQVFRRYDDEGRCAGDTVTLEGETAPGAPLLQRVMSGGRPTRSAPTTARVREHAADELARLPDTLRDLEPADRYPVEIAAPVRELAAEVDRMLERPDPRLDD